MSHYRLLGSGTPIVNFDASTMKSFQDFLEEEHDVDVQMDGLDLAALELELENALPVSGR